MHLSVVFFLSSHSSRDRLKLGVTRVRCPLDRIGKILREVEPTSKIEMILLSSRLGQVGYCRIRSVSTVC